MSKVIVFATPVFFLLIALEFAWGRAKGRNTYRLQDAISSIGLVHALAARGGVYRCLCESLAGAARCSERVLGKLVWLGAGADFLWFLLLLAAPRRPRSRRVLGSACGASPKPRLQPVHRAAADF
jgi:hypothetical protein